MPGDIGDRGGTGHSADGHSHSRWPGSADRVPAESSSEKSGYSLRLFGPFELKHRGIRVHSLKSAKVRALLAYLVTESQLPQSRNTIASLLWPTWSDNEALANLRSSLYNLRRALKDRPRIDLSKDQIPFLQSDNQTVQFNVDADAFWVDVWEFEGLAGSNCEDPKQAARCQNAISLYRDDFLQGFLLKDCPAFEEWLALKREMYAHKMSRTLGFLANYYEQQSQYEEAAECLRQILLLDPWNEIIYQQLMRILYFSGNRAAALTQFRICREMLFDELGVEPLEETVLLRNNILTGSL